MSKRAILALKEDLVKAKKLNKQYEKFSVTVVPGGKFGDLKVSKSDFMQGYEQLKHRDKVRYKFPKTGKSEIRSRLFFENIATGKDHIRGGNVPLRDYMADKYVFFVKRGVPLRVIDRVVWGGILKTRGSVKPPRVKRSVIAKRKAGAKKYTAGLKKLGVYSWFGRRKIKGEYEIDQPNVRKPVVVRESFPRTKSGRLVRKRGHNRRKPVIRGSS